MSTSDLSDGRPNLTPSARSTPVRRIRGRASRSFRDGRSAAKDTEPAPNDGWRNFLDVPEPRRVGLFQYFVFNNPSWDWRSMDWDKDVAFTTSTMGFLNATAHDLHPFLARGGKIVMHTGWVDPILPAPDVIKYYEDVTASMGGSDRDAKVLSTVHGARDGTLQRRARAEHARRADGARNLGRKGDRSGTDHRDPSAR